MAGISSHSKIFGNLDRFLTLSSSSSNLKSKKSVADFALHQQWSNQEGWKATLNNFRLVIQPTILFWMIAPWLDVFPNRSLLLGFHRLLGVMNQFSFYLPDG